MGIRLYVGNLPQNVTDAEFERLVKDAGLRVLSVGVVRNKATGISWGFGFIHLEHDEDFQSAVAWIKRQTLLGSALLVLESGRSSSQVGNPSH